MDKKKYVYTFAFLLIFFVIIIVLAIVLPQKEKLDVKQITFKNEDILMMTKAEKRICEKEIVKLLAKLEYLDTREVTFYINSIDSSKNKKYFYAMLDDYDKTLLEITKLGNKTFIVKYLSNNKFMNEKSEDTGVSYAQIIDPEEYKKELELEKMRKEAEKALPDDSWVG